MIGFKSGQAMMEVLLALAITSLTLIAVTRLSTRSLTNSNTARDSGEAKILADSGMEWIKQQKLYDPTYSVWSNFIGRSGSTTPGSTRVYCMSTLAWGAVQATTCSGVCADAATGYRRVVTVTGTTANSVNVQVNVYRSGTCTSQIDLNTVFTNYQ